MKKIIFTLTSLLIIVLVITSCTEEENLIGYPYQQENVFENIVGTVTTPTPVNGEGWNLDITITIPKSFTSKATLEVTGTLKTGVQSIIDTITIPAGSTTVDAVLPIPTDAPDSGFTGIPDFFSVELTGLLLEELEPGINYTISSEPLNVLLYDAIQYPYGDGVVDGRMTYLIDWENPSVNDLDAFVSDLEDSGTGDRYEFDIFDDTHPDGTYTIDVYTYSIMENQGDLPWRVFFVYPDQTTFEIFEGTITGVTQDEFYPLVEFTKTTDPETQEVTYSNVTAL
nr:hypothetical protein [uncultured Allomuricauda sp.]